MVGPCVDGSNVHCQFSPVAGSELLLQLATRQSFSLVHSSGTRCITGLGHTVQNSSRLRHARYAFRYSAPLNDQIAGRARRWAVL
jgi:hypothetical protein